MFHRHKWKVLTYKRIDFYEFSHSKRPHRYETHISQMCEKCGEPRVKKVYGIWNAAGKLGEKN